MSTMTIQPGEYVYVVERAADGTFWAHFPDLPGCTSAADTLEALEQRVKQALDLYLSYYRDRGEQPPAPTHVKAGVVAA